MKGDEIKVNSKTPEINKTFSTSDGGGGEAEMSFEKQFDFRLTNRNADQDNF